MRHTLQKLFDEYTASKGLAVNIAQILKEVKDEYGKQIKSIDQERVKVRKEIKDTRALNAAIAALDEQASNVKVGDLLVHRIEAAVPTLSARQKESLRGLDRTPDTVRQVVGSVAGPDKAVAAAWSESDYRKMVQEYGLLMSVLKDMLSIDNSDSKKYILTLLSSLETLNAGIYKDDEFQVPVIKSNKGLIESGIYKNKITNIINAFKAYDLINAFNDITAFVAQARLDVEKSEDYRKRMHEVRDTLSNVMMQELVKNVESLNANKEPVVGIPFKGNAPLYRALKGAFGSVSISSNRRARCR